MNNARLFLLSLWYVWWMICPGMAQCSPESGRVVVLGFDGADPQLLREWMAQGKLPHLARLAERGTFCELATTHPAESPVAWSTFATGKNPGEHGIFGFLKRDAAAYRPQLALARVEKRPLLGGMWGRIGLATLAALLACAMALTAVACWRRIRCRPQTRPAWSRWLALATVLAATIACPLCWWLPEAVPYAVAAKEGPSFWTMTAEAGVPTVVLGAPLAFPAESVPHGRLLCGLGVPDVCGTNGLWFRYSTRFTTVAASETGGWTIPLEPAADKAGVRMWHGLIIGPPNVLLAEEDIRLQARLDGSSLLERRRLLNRLAEIRANRYLRQRLTVRQGDKRLVVEIDGKSQEVKEGEWSDWFGVRFVLSPLLSIDANARLFVMASEPPEIYLTPLQFDPRRLPPNIDISFPRKFAADMAEAVGDYATLGWAGATNALKDEQLSEQGWWRDLELLMRDNERKLRRELARSDWRLLVSVFYETDMASHMYYRFIDSDNPRHAQDCADYPEFRDSLLRVYQWMDAVVGDTADRLNGDDLLLVVSDHGFAPFRWEVNLNKWLIDEGYLVPAQSGPRSQIIDLFVSENPLVTRFDWPHSRAYALGLGEIYLNLQGREASGCVPASQSHALAEELRQKLLALRHQGRQVIDRVHLRDEIFQGRHVGDAGDLLVGFARGYRVSWQTTLGNVASQVVEANTLKWSGDHCSVSSRLVPGILLASRKIGMRQPGLVDLAPTLLRLFGISLPAYMAGRPLFDGETK